MKSLPLLLATIALASCDPETEAAAPESSFSIHVDGLVSNDLGPPIGLERTDEPTTVTLGEVAIEVHPPLIVEYDLATGGLKHIDTIGGEPTELGPSRSGVWIEGQALDLVDGRLRIGEKDLGPLNDGQTALVQEDGVFVQGRRRGSAPRRR